MLNIYLDMFLLKYIFMIMNQYLTIYREFIVNENRKTLKWEQAGED